MKRVSISPLSPRRSRKKGRGVGGKGIVLAFLLTALSVSSVNAQEQKDAIRIKMTRPDGETTAKTSLPITQRPQPKMNFRLLWKADFTDKPRRIAVADVMGDGKPRLITLHEIADKPDTALLVVRNWNGKNFVIDYKEEVKGKSDLLAVGYFAGAELPAAIVVEDGFFLWDGKAFVKHSASRRLPIFGTVRAKDGEERLLISEGSETVRAYRIRPTEPNNWLADGKDIPKPGNIAYESLNADPKQLEKMKMPPELSAGGLIGLWDVRDTTQPILYYTMVDRDFDVASDSSDKTKPKITYKQEAYQFVCRDALDPQGVPFWGTPRIDAKPLDAAIKNPQNGKPGLLLLVGELPKGSYRSLLFFALE